MKIYTKQGDYGKTKLANGITVPKDHAMIEALGAVDELNTMLGYAVAQHNIFKTLLQKIQNDLFEIGSELAGAGPCTLNVLELEKEIDLLQENTPRLKNFILPGGTASAAFAHICASVCRRAERDVVKVTPDNKNILIYLNRLSDLLFCIARYENYNQATPDIIWKKNEHQRND